MYKRQELDTIIKKLYESFAVGRITGERFDSLLAEYEADICVSISEKDAVSAFCSASYSASRQMCIRDRVHRVRPAAKIFTDFTSIDFEAAKLSRQCTACLLYTSLDPEALVSRRSFSLGLPPGRAKTMEAASCSEMAGKDPRYEPHIR